MFIKYMGLINGNQKS